MDTLTLIDTPENKIENNTSSAIIANVVRRLLRNQIEEYRRARVILDASERRSETADKIIDEEPGVVAALYACVYEQNGQLRVDDDGQPLIKNFIESKVLNLKSNPYKNETALLLRGIFMSLRAKMGKEFQKCWREIFHRLHIVKENQT